MKAAAAWWRFPKPCPVTIAYGTSTPAATLTDPGNEIKKGDVLAVARIPDPGAKQNALAFPLPPIV